MKNAHYVVRELEVPFESDTYGVMAELEYSYTIERWTDGAGERRHSIYAKFESVVWFDAAPFDMGSKGPVFAERVVEEAKKNCIDQVESDIAESITKTEKRNRGFDYR